MLYPIFKEYYDRASTVVQKEPPTDHYHTHLMKASYTVTKEGGSSRGTKYERQEDGEVKRATTKAGRSKEGMKVCKKKAVCH